MTFAEKVYGAVMRIPAGRVATYGQIADIIGCPGASRAVGNALHANPYAPGTTAVSGHPAVPCHRVVASDGSLAARFGCGGAEVQYSRLIAEGVTFVEKRPAFHTMIPRVDMSRCAITVEKHPLEPFLPPNGRILFLGSFPPPRARWSMEFFYPNWINDFWRIQGLIHFDDPCWFESGTTAKSFDRQRIVDFCAARGLAFYDTASMVCRLKGNASDEFLAILAPADIALMLARMPDCRTIVTTGGKSAEELSSILPAAMTETSNAGLPVPAIGACADVVVSGRAVRWWRMPSTSRAYPMPMRTKASYYARLFDVD